MRTATNSPASGGWSEDILTSNAPPETPIVENLIYPGLGVVVGPPKAGKTNFGFQLASAVAQGVPLFEGFESVAGKVLYIALEEMPTLTASRFAKMGVSLPPQSVYVEYTFPPLSRGGATHIGNFIATNPETKLVVVDVLQRLRGHTGKSSYRADYQELTSLHQLGNESGAAIVLLHHTTKKVQANWQASIYGTQGLAAAADTAILLDRPDLSEKGRLCVTGRKCATREWLVEFHPETLTWSMVGEVKATDLTPERRAIMEALEDTCGGFLTPRQLAQETSLGNKSIFNILVKLRESGLVEKAKRGRYAITPMGLKALNS